MQQLVSSITDETAAMKKQIANPEALNYKGITISPAGSFLAAETVDRTAATGGGLNTQFTGVPLQYADAAQMSEFQGTGRQSRLAIKAVGKLDNMTMTGYYEMDWLGAGITSNNNQSQQLCHAPAATVGRCQVDQRLGLLRRPGMVAGRGNHQGSYQRN